MDDRPGNTPELSMVDAVDAPSAGRLLCQAFIDTFHGGGWADPIRWEEFDEDGQARCEAAAARYEELRRNAPSGAIVGIVAQALYDAENTARLSEHPDAVPAYRRKASELLRWITILGGQVSIADGSEAVHQ